MATDEPKKAIPVDSNLTSYTAEETRALFLDCARMIARYWAGVDLHRARPPAMPELTPLQDRLERAEGVVFSMLCLLDGVSDGFPAVTLTIAPHPDDKAFHQARGERWYEPETAFNDGVYMHDELNVDRRVDPDEVKAKAPTSPTEIHE